MATPPISRSSLKEGFSMNIWDLLGLQPTQDIREIRRAYAKKVKTVHSEENPDGFQLLRTAYEQALSLAKKPGQARLEPETPLSPVERGDASPPAGEPEEMETSVYDFDQLLDRGLQKYSAALLRLSSKVLLELCALCGSGSSKQRQEKFAAYFQTSKFRQVRELPAFLEALSVKMQRSPQFPGWARRLIFEEYGLKALKSEDRLENYACLYRAIEHRETVELIVYKALCLVIIAIGCFVAVRLKHINRWLMPGTAIATGLFSARWLNVSAKRYFCIL